MQVLSKLAACILPVALGISACQKTPAGPPPQRSLTISVSSGAAPVKDLTGQVVLVPYDAGRQRLFDAMLTRRKTEVRLRQELAELEKQLPAIATEVVEPVQASDQGLDRLVGAARRTIESLADLALLYYEEVAEQKGKELPLERLAAFRDKLGVDELKRSSAAIKGTDLEGTRTAIATVHEILNREVYKAERMGAEKARTENVLKQLDSEISKAPATRRASAAAPRASTAGPGSNTEVYLRYMRNRADLQQATDPLVAFNSLGKVQVAAATTDDQGKATVSIPPTGRYIIGVAFNRPGEDLISRNFGMTESFCWIQEVPAQGNQISFNKDNIMKPSVAPLGLEQDTPWR